MRCPAMRIVRDCAKDHQCVKLKDLPPLVLKSPGDFTAEIGESFYKYKLSKSKFLVTDDSGMSPKIRCSIDGISDRHSSYYKWYNYFSWNLPVGTHEVYCDIEDNKGNIVTKTHTVKITKDPLSPSWVKTLAKWNCYSYLSQDLYLVVIKYLNVADVMTFDISASGMNDRPSPSFKHDTCKWSYGKINSETYKNALERMADRGVFRNIDLSF